MPWFHFLNLSGKVGCVTKSVSLSLSLNVSDWVTENVTYWAVVDTEQLKTNEDFDKNYNS